MTSTLYRDQPDVQKKFIAVELAERWCRVVCRAVLLVLTVALVVTAIICALRGMPWPIAAGTGCSGIFMAVSSAVRR